jgi:hypothetical protein
MISVRMGGRWFHQGGVKPSRNHPRVVGRVFFCLTDQGGSIVLGQPATMAYLLVLLALADTGGKEGLPLITIQAN